MIMSRVSKILSVKGAELGLSGAVVLLMLSIATPARAELPPPTANMQLIPTGSLIIAMDNDKQNIGAVFNLKAYGLANKLLWENIRLRWAIRAGKAKDGIDFTVEAQRILPTAIGPATLDFRGGPFIVHRDWAVDALPHITAFGNDVAVYETTADVMVDVRFTLDQKKKVGVLDDGGNSDIHTDILVEAGFVAGVQYVVIPATTLLTVNANACFTTVTEPHWNTSTNDAETDAIRQFTESGGNFMAQCVAVTSYENNTTYGLFQSTLGIVGNNLNNASHVHPNPDLAYSQFEGILYDDNGTVRDYELAAGSVFQNGAHSHVHNTTDPDRYIATASKLVGGDGSNVMYLGGHEYDGTNIANMNGKRMYMNAAMMPSDRPSICGFDFLPPPPLPTLTKTAFWTDGTPIPTGATIPSGIEFKFLLYINNPGLATGDVTVRDVLDPAFQYQAGTIQVDNSIAECAAASCTVAEELAIYNAVDGAAFLSDAADGDVASHTLASLSVDAGNGNVGNAQLNIDADKVWAILFSVKMP
jgi:hypothetical protein